MVGPRRFRRGPDAVHLRHPGLHPAEGLAPAQPLRLKLTLFDLDHTLLDGDSDQLWCEFLLDRGVLPRQPFESLNREMARDFLAVRALQPDSFAASEVDRYLGIPGQAISYKVGEREILDIRKQAMAEAGASFDSKDFHRRLLDAGAIRLDHLREVMA